MRDVSHDLMYARVRPLVAGLRPDGGAAGRLDRVGALLEAGWVDAYAVRHGAVHLVRVPQSRFAYLFDAAAQRLVAAWGISAGRHTGGARDAARMRGTPRTGGHAYHRGHAIAHSLRGGTDLNLVPQLGRVNVGEFRTLERRAVATPGALYFTRWLYGDGTVVAHGSTERVPTQIPDAVQQGLLVPGVGVFVQEHGNRP